MYKASSCDWRGEGRHALAESAMLGVVQTPSLPASLNIADCALTIAIMSQFRAAKLDIGCFAKIRNIRDHTKRKVYAENEPERCAPLNLDNHA